jgi:hypothetical protein
VPLKPNQAARLARAFRDLRETTWPDHVLTQSQLAKVFSSEGSGVAPATLSSWESTTNPKTPSAARISAYARFFCTPRSLEGGPHLIPEDQLTPAEHDRLRELESDLFELFNPKEPKARRSFSFDAGPIVVICPDAPPEVWGPLADERDPNFTKLRKYGDLDALIELYGHLRAENPTLEIFHRLASEVVSDDLSRHVILLGGIGWNEITRRFQSAISQVPITQTAVDDLKSGDIFRVGTEDDPKPKLFYPEYEDRPENKELTSDAGDSAEQKELISDVGDSAEQKELISDVGYLARLHNPFKINRTLTICNGIFSRGVFGAVRCLTDASVREENEKYLAERFPDPDVEFAMLLRVPVVTNETLSPDLQNPDARLYEWAPNDGVRR